MDADLDASTFVVVPDPEGGSEPVALFSDGSWVRGWTPRAARP